MDNSLILDLLFIVFVLLFSLIGFSRGVIKEGLASGGILFGALLADNWSARFGTVGSNLLSITTNASRFFTIECLIVASALVIGYGSGSLLVPQVRGLGARAGGAVIGALNGAFLLAFSLRAAREDIGRLSVQHSLHDSIVSRMLIERFNWLLLIASGIVLVLIFGRLVAEREPRNLSSPAAQAGPRRSARLPAPREAAKLEPIERGFDVTTERYEADAPRLDDVEPTLPSARQTLSLDRIYQFGSSARLDDDPETWRTIRFFDRRSEQTVPAAEERRCPQCNELLSTDDVYCPSCGAPTSVAQHEHEENHGPSA